MISKEQLRELCDEINTVALDEKDFNLKILVYMIATELMLGKPAEYRQRLEDTLNFLMPRVKDPSLWPNIELCPVSTLWSLFDMDNRKIFFLVAKVRIGDAPCEIVFRQEMKRNGEYRAMYFIDFLNHKNKTEAFRKQFSKQEILLVRTPLERLRGLRDSFFNASRKTIYEAEANLNSSGFLQLNTLFDTLDEIAGKIKTNREIDANNDPVKAKEIRKQRFIQYIQDI